MRIRGMATIRDFSAISQFLAVWVRTRLSCPLRLIPVFCSIAIQTPSWVFVPLPPQGFISGFLIHRIPLEKGD